MIFLNDINDFVININVRNSVPINYQDLKCKPHISCTMCKFERLVCTHNER